MVYGEQCDLFFHAKFIFAVLSALFFSADCNNFTDALTVQLYQAHIKGIRGERPSPQMNPERPVSASVIRSGVNTMLL